MNPLKIIAEWDDEANVYVATSDDVDGLAIEASTMDALIERLKVVIPELMEANHKAQAGDELPFLLDGFFTTRNPRPNHTR
jgi:predicted RNase H-like HicB family nuclease